MNVQELVSILKPWFNNVYCGVTTMVKGQNSSPRYWDGNEYVYVGLDESECNKVYIRELSDPMAIDSGLGGCSPCYDDKYFYRVVVYIRKKKCGQDMAAYRQRLTQLLSHKDIKITRKIYNPNRLARMEQTTEITLMGNVVFFAFDIEMLERYNHCCPPTEEDCKPIKECKKC